MYPRQLYSLLEGRLTEPSPLIQVVAGPRQVGKTTAIQQVLQGRGIYRSADSPTPLPAAVIAGWWDEAIGNPAAILAIDEVQKITGWSEELKRLWDSMPGRLKVIVTGSSALLVEKGLSEALTGRFELIRVEHWNFDEANRIFNMSLRDYVEFGCYPGAQRFLEHKADESEENSFERSVERWASYVRDSIVEPALGRDLLLLSNVEQPALLRQVFGVASSMPGEIVSLQKLQGQLQGRGSLPTIQNYLRLLGSCFLVTALEKYSLRLLRTRSSTPKLIVHDNALVRAFERPPAAPLTPERFGRYFENCIGARFIESGWDTFYWKDRDVEVDFIVRGPKGERWAVEVKSSDVKEKDLNGLRVFCSKFPDFEPCLVSFTEQEFAGIRAINPVDILRLHR